MEGEPSGTSLADHRRALGAQGWSAGCFEVSIKTPVAQGAAATAGFMAFLAEAGAVEDDGQQAEHRVGTRDYAQPRATQCRRVLNPSGRRV